MEFILLRFHKLEAQNQGVVRAILSLKVLEETMPHTFLQLSAVGVLGDQSIHCHLVISLCV